MQSQPSGNSQEEQLTAAGSSEQEQALLSDHDFEKLKADVFNTGQLGGLASSAPQRKTHFYYYIFTIQSFFNVVYVLFCNRSHWMYDKN